MNDARARIQLVDLPIVARVAAKCVAPGARLDVTLVRAEAATRTVAFEPT